MVDLEKLYKNYIILFFEENYKSNSSICDGKYNIDEIYKYVNKFYYQVNNKRLDISKKENRDKLYNFLNRKFQYRLLNDNLRQVYEKLTEGKEDEYFINGLEKIVDIVKDSLYEIKDYKNVDLGELPEMSHEELDTYFMEFLTSIDKSNDMLNVYKKMKRDNKIIYIDYLDEKAKKEFMESLNVYQQEYNDYFVNPEYGEGYIILDRKENINDLKKLVHEFMHYYSFQYNKDKKPSVLTIEFPSIFFELVACNFLIEKGYDSEIVDKLSCMRFNQINNISSYTSAVNYYIGLYNKNKEVTKKDDIETLKNKILNYVDENGINSYVGLDINKYGDMEKMTSDYCDFANFYMSLDSEILNKGYSYIIGNKLAVEFLTKYSKRELSLDEMIDITRKLPNIGIEELFSYFDKKEEYKKIKK